MVDLLPVVTGNKFALRSVSTEGKHGLQLPVPTENEVALLPKIGGSEFFPPRRAVVDDGHLPPLAVVENRPILLSIPAADGQIIVSAKAGRRRGLLLAGVGNELVPLSASVIGEYIPLLVTTCGGFVFRPSETTGDGVGFLPGLSNMELLLLTVLVGGGGIVLSALTGSEYNRLLGSIVADLLLYRLAMKDKSMKRLDLINYTRQYYTGLVTFCCI